MLLCIFERKEANFAEIVNTISKNLTNLQPKRRITELFDNF